MNVVRLGCIDEPPPRLVMLELDFAGPLEGCPEAWEACLSNAASGRLARYISAVQTWSHDAWLSCALEKEKNHVENNQAIPEEAPGQP